MRVLFNVGLLYIIVMSVLPDGLEELVSHMCL